MIKNIIFDFGAVLVDWNPHYVYDPYFGDRQKADWFIENICTAAWNKELDGGKPFSQGVAELSAQYPEWAKEIALYHRDWKKMMGGPIPGMYELVADLKKAGYGIYGLTNWASETFYTIVDDYPVFGLLDGMVVSGDVRLLKPDAAIFRCLLDKYGLKADESIFIDDNAENVEGAAAAGVEAHRFVDAGELRRWLVARGIRC
ncbi:MAG: HAD family phosphatase [Bacteroidales bacterium]|nr:HAD family phosphatase [Bacteroidales bacterium]